MFTNFLLALFAYKSGALDKKGIICAYILGVLVFFADIKAYIVLLLFFVAETVAETILNKRDNEKRSFLQVLANFCFPLISLILIIVLRKNSFFVLFSALLAEVMSDTLASTTGTKYAKKVFSVVGFKPIEKGVSGGISCIGTVAGFLGSLFVAVVYSLTSFIFRQQTSVSDFLFITAVGFFGMITDSVIGAVFQKKNQCEICGKISDKCICCNYESKHIRGLLTNSQVNFVTQFISFLVGLLLLNI